MSGANTSIRTSWAFPPTRSLSRTGPTRFRRRQIEPVGKLQVGVIGYGTAARAVGQGIAEGTAGPARLAAILVRRQIADAPGGALVTSDRSAFLAEPLDVVVELAGQEAVAQHGVAVL